MPHLQPLGKDTCHVSILRPLHHKGLGRDENDRNRIAAEPGGGKADVGVVAPPKDPAAVLEDAAVSAKLADPGDVPETHTASDKAQEHAQPAAPGRRPALPQRGPAGRQRTRNQKQVRE